jgi:hypothetical protein
MGRPTPGANDRRLSDLEGDGRDRADADLCELAIERRPADPEARPEGMAFDRETGTLAYDFWRAQGDCLDRLGDPEADVVAFLAGYGAGKSIVGARWLFTSALQYPGSRFLAMGQSFSEARHSTFQVLFNALPGDRTHLVTSAYNGPESSPLVTDYNRAEHRLTLANDSVIILGSADKWSRHAGEEFGGIWMDEPSHYGEDLHDLLEMMGGRLRGVAGPKVMCWTLTGNGYNAAWEILEKREDTNGDPIGLNIDVVRASSLENPYLSAGEKEGFKRQYGGTGREEQALYGGFAAATGLVYSQFSREAHVIPDRDARDRVDPDWRIYGYDSGWNDPRVLLEVGRTPYDQLVVIDEFYESGTHVEDAIAWLNQSGKPNGTIFCEHVPAEIEKFNRAGWPTAKAEKDIDAGIADVRKRFESDGNMDLPDGGSESLATSGRPTISSTWGTTSRTGRGSRSATESDTADTEKEPHVGLLVSDHCEHLIRELLSYKEEEVGTSAASDHCCDSLRYCVHTSANAQGGTVTRRTPGSAGKINRR